MASNFFQPGTTYSHRRDRYAAPEECRIFLCASVTTLPGSENRIAFGFLTSAVPGSPWITSALGEREWSWTWTVHTEGDTPTEH